MLRLHADASPALPIFAQRVHPGPITACDKPLERRFVGCHFFVLSSPEVLVKMQDTIMGGDGVSYKVKRTLLRD
jgi:hypothetical protein